MLPRRICSSAVLLCVLMATVLGVAGCGSGDKSAPPSFGPDIEARIDQLVNNAMSFSNIPGVIVGAWAPGQGSYVKAYGMADITSGEPMQTQDRVRIASITKTFVATVALQLVDEGRLGLDQTIAGYLPQIPQSGIITIRELLNHSSGIYDYEDQAFIRSAAENPLKVWTPEQLIALAVSHPATFAPGSSCAYSNTNYIALGLIIQQVTGNRLEDEITKRIIEPLNLSNTDFPVGPDMSGQYSHGYMDMTNSGQLTDITRMDMSWDWAAGGMVSNLDDLKVWAEALGTGQLISPAMQNERLKWISMPEFGNFASYGLGILKIGDFIGHTGADPGYNSAMYYLPEKDAVIVVLFNYCSGTDIVDVTSLGIGKALFPDVSLPF